MFLLITIFTFEIILLASSAKNHDKLAYPRACLLICICCYEEMGTRILGNTLQTRCMDLESISLEMDIGMKVPGMREVGRVLACILSEVVKCNLGTGTTGFWIFPAHKSAILDLLDRSAIQGSLMLSR